MSTESDAYDHFMGYDEPQPEEDDDVIRRRDEMTSTWAREEPGLYTANDMHYAADIAKCADGWAWHIHHAYKNLSDEGFVETLAAAKRAVETARGYFPA
jgi:hypothetical protein